MEEQPFDDAILQDHSLTMMDIIFEKVIKDIINEQGTKSIVADTLDDSDLPCKLFAQFDDFPGGTEVGVPKVNVKTRNREKPNKTNVLIQSEENQFVNSFFDAFFLEMISEAANGKRNLNIEEELNPWGNNRASDNRNESPSLPFKSPSYFPSNLESVNASKSNTTTNAMVKKNPQINSMSRVESDPEE